MPKYDCTHQTVSMASLQTRSTSHFASSTLQHEKHYRDITDSSRPEHKAEYWALYSPTDLKSGSRTYGVYITIDRVILLMKL